MFRKKKVIKVYNNKKNVKKRRPNMMEYGLQLYDMNFIMKELIRAY